MNYQRHSGYRIMQNNDTLMPVKYPGLYKGIGVRKKISRMWCVYDNCIKCRVFEIQQISRVSLRRFLPKNKKMNKIKVMANKA